MVIWFWGFQNGDVDHVAIVVGSWWVYPAFPDLFFQTELIDTKTTLWPKKTCLTSRNDHLQSFFTTSAGIAALDDWETLWSATCAPKIVPNGEDPLSGWEILRRGPVPLISKWWLLLVPSWELTFPLPKVLLKIIFLFPSWDMLVPCKVTTMGFDYTRV